MPSKKDPKSLAERVATLENDMGWVKKILEKIDRRTWWILGSVVALGLIAVVIALIRV